MRSSVSFMLSHGSGEPVMSHPDYEQHAHHHGSLLVLVRGIGPSKPRSLQKIFERLQKVNNVKINDLNGQVRDIWVRFVQDHPVENNDWGDFQTHRRLLGLITVGKFDNQSELNELCRVHESLKVKYTSTLYDSRCVLFNGRTVAQRKKSSVDHDGDLSSYNSLSSSNKDASSLDSESSVFDDGRSLAQPSGKIEDRFTTPSNFKSQAFFYTENDACVDLEANVVEFLNSLFWILESKRLEKSREKIDKVVLLQAPFEKKDFVGLDLDTRNNRKRLSGRVTKNLGDLTLQAGLVAESLQLFHTANETLRAISDSLWLAAANEGLCAASAILLYPNIRCSLSLQRNASLPTDQFSPNKQTERSTGSTQDTLAKQILGRKSGLNIALETDTIVKTDGSTSVSSPTSSVSSSMSTSSSVGTISGSTAAAKGTSTDTLEQPDLPANILQPDDIVVRYRDAIINYSKYRHAGIIETEAALKAARICIEQHQNLDVAMFLQNVLYINLNMNEQERVARFETLTELYQRIGYHRKAAFCQRLAAWRHVAQSNATPDWSQSYRLMLDSFAGHKLSLDPIEVLHNNCGWPCLQIDLLQQLVIAARRLGHSALATRHMTFLLQTMWKHMTAGEQREMSIQLQTLSAQCEGAPVPLVLENGTVIPPANLTELPFCEGFQVQNLPAHMRPHKIIVHKIDCSPFLFTPIHFTSSIERKAKKNDSKIAFQWVQNDLCAVTVRLRNPLPFELRVGDIRLLTNGVVFESLPETVVLPIGGTSSTAVTLHGTPIEHGALELLGYSTHTLGVKSNCRLKTMFSRVFPVNYTVDVIPALPKLMASTSLPQTATFNGMANSDCVIVSAGMTIYNGESSECVITLTNGSKIPIEFLDESLLSSLDAKAQARVFQWSHEELQSKLPIPPNGSIEFTVTVYGDADFLGPLVNTEGGSGGVTSLPSTGGLHVNDTGPSSLSGAMSTLSVSGHASLPSRVSSPINAMGLRRTELTSSFRSTQSGHSSLATISLGAACAVGSSSVRNLNAQLRLRYSGGNGLSDGYCRQCAIAFHLEFMPSAQVTNWDVLPAEIPSQFYLVLDVINLTAQEMSLYYTPSKNIIIEAKESCRVPVPVEKCPLERLTAVENTQSTIHADSLLSNGTTDTTDLTERTCSEHISDQVNLQWTLTGTNTHGLTSLKGISLSAAMLGLITVAPLQWEIFIDKNQIAPQAEVTCAAGQDILVGVRICNLSPAPLTQLTLTIQFYQDFQNGIQNYKLETRVIISGPDQIAIDSLNRNETAFHECSAIFFTPGRFKADIQCVSQQSLAKSASVSIHDQQYAGGIKSTAAADSQVWRFIPPLDITVTE